MSEFGNPTKFKFTSKTGTWYYWEDVNSNNNYDVKVSDVYNYGYQNRNTSADKTPAVNTTYTITASHNFYFYSLDNGWHMAIIQIW